MRWAVALVIFCFGIVTLDFYSYKWIFLGFFLFSIPLLCQFTRSEMLWSWSIWGGLFLILQTFLSIYMTNEDFKTLPPNLNMSVNHEEGLLPGIAGPQTITTDEKGFRVTHKIDYNSDAGFRVFAIGASTTEEIDLDDQKTWTSTLESELGKYLQTEVEVINTGVSGLRARHHLATLREILPYHPDMVIFLVGINDWNWHIDQHFDSLQDHPDRESPRSRYFLRNSLLGNAINSAKYMFGEQQAVVREDIGEQFANRRGSLNRPQKHSFRPDEVHPQYNEYIKQITTTCRENDLDCVFITQPNGYQQSAGDEYRKGLWMTPPWADYTLDFDSMEHIANVYNSHLKQFAATQALPLCDLAPDFPPGYEFFYDDCHYNEKGSRHFSRQLLSCLKGIPDLPLHDVESDNSLTPP